MKIARLLREDSGSAAIEFIVLGLLAQCLILTFGLGALQSQRQQLAVTLAARQAARLVTQDPQGATGLESFSQDLEGSFGLEPGSLKLSLSPVSPQSGQLVSASAVIGAIRSTVVMRVPR